MTAPERPGPRLPAQVLRANEYVPDWSGLPRDNLIRLDRNEATRPFSPTISEALTTYIQTQGVHSYPDTARLCEKLADYCGVSRDAVLPTNGSDQAIEICLRAFLTPGATMLVARPEFVIFSHVAELLDARVLGVPYGPDFVFPYDEFRAAAAEHRPDVIVLINPNNPTGTPIDTDFIMELVRAYPETPVVVDEAYFEFTRATVVAETRDHPNLLVLRTFSKAFAMAGLRLGYVVAQPEMIRQLVKIRNPFDVNALAIVAGMAQLGRIDEMWASVDQMMTEVKPRVVDFFRHHDVPMWPGAASFVLVRPAKGDAVVQALREAGILVRRMSSPTLAGMFRMNLGTHDEMTRVLDVYGGLLPIGGGREVR